MDNMSQQQIPESTPTWLPPTFDRRRRPIGYKGGWGRVLKQPRFSDLAGFRSQVDKLDFVEKRKAYVETLTPISETEAEQVLDEAIGWYGVTSLISGKTYSMRSDVYAPVQDAEVMQPILDVLEASDIQPQGWIGGVGSGRTFGFMIFKNPEFQLDVLPAYNEVHLMGMRWWNSYTGETSFGADTFAVRSYCMNGNLWGDLIASYGAKHAYEVRPDPERFKKVVFAIIEKIEDLKDLVCRKVDEKLVLVEAESLTWALNLSPNMIETIVPNARILNPDIDYQGLSVWGLYQAVTAFVTHRQDSDLHLATTEKYLESATDLLTYSVSELIEKGDKRKEKWLEAQRNKERMKAERKAEVIITTKGREFLGPGEF